MKDLRNIQYIILLLVISCVSSSYAQDNHEEHLYFDDVTYFKKHNHKPNKYLMVCIMVASVIPLPAIDKKNTRNLLGH